MALSQFQQDLCRLIADNRRAEGAAPDAAVLGRQWHAILERAERIVNCLPIDNIGCCVLDAEGNLFAGDHHSLAGAMARGALQFHAGSIRGAFPQIG